MRLIFEQFSATKTFMQKKVFCILNECAVTLDFLFRAEILNVPQESHVWVDYWQLYPSMDYSIGDYVKECAVMRWACLEDTDY